MFKFSNLLKIYSQGKLSYSQEGEDVLLDYYLGGKKNGFYVDVGAHHPIRYSNTYRFYRRGWWGINIDATPGSMQTFEKIRPRDINLERGVSEKEGNKRFYQFDEPALNTFDKKLADRSIKSGNQLKKKIKIKTYTLRMLLKKFLPKGVPIDFMSIDTEGYDLKVLKSNDWTSFYPQLVVVEVLGNERVSLSAVNKLETSKFLKSLGYMPISKLDNSLVFKTNL